jgi:hypothetical protein
MALKIGLTDKAGATRAANTAATVIAALLARAVGRADGRRVLGNFARAGVADEPFAAVGIGQAFSVRRGVSIIRRQVVIARGRLGVIHAVARRAADEPFGALGIDTARELWVAAKVIYPALVTSGGDNGHGKKYHNQRRKFYSFHICSLLFCFGMVYRPDGSGGHGLDRAILVPVNMGLWPKGAVLFMVNREVVEK